VLHYRKRFLLVFINFECAGIVNKGPGGEECEFDCSRISDEIVAYIEKLLRSMQLNDIAVEIGLTLQGWQLIELLRPPLSWPSAEGVINRYRYISCLIESDRL
jgi:hypothetical protein